MNLECRIDMLHAGNVFLKNGALYLLKEFFRDFEPKEKDGMVYNHCYVECLNLNTKKAETFMPDTMVLSITATLTYRDIDGEWKVIEL